MSLNALLQNLLGELPDALGVVLADWEGEAVAHAARMDDFELKVFGAHHGIILDSLRQAAARLGEPGVEEVAIHADDRLILVKPVTEEYFVVLALANEGLLSRASHVLQAYAAQLHEEVA
ncbi:MAG: roadblock/LC7 domain-containing protein [Geoalkalibacter sp.]|uniref:roadblock/LC7 domain-containing protein n=1 Tax=Geoalkalibacter sp. TaxID=3041440 RepID=UPI003D11B804